MLAVVQVSEQVGVSESTGACKILGSEIQSKVSNEGISTENIGEQGKCTKADS